MASVRVFAVALAAAASCCAHAVEERTASRHKLNPIRKVVTMLQAMQKKVGEEGEAEKRLYDQFMCYCKTGSGDLSASISAAEDKVPALSSSIETAEGKLKQCKADLKEGQEDRSAAKNAMAEATAVREKEASAFASLKADYQANIAAVAKAVTAVENGMGGSFVQTGAAQILRRVAAKANILDVDRQELTAFLSQASGYAPQSGQIVGILKQMGDEMSEFLADATDTEKNAIHTYEGLMAAKKKEVGALTATVESKTAHIGELGVAIAQMKADLSDTEEALAQDQKFLAELKSSCATKTAEWEERSKTRAEELVALADTIKVLNDDDALEIFKKTLPSAGASLVQVQVSASAMRARALSAIRAAQRSADRRGRPALDLLALTLAGKRALSEGGFDKVIKMIDGMVETLKKEQVDDDSKKEYCGTQFDESDDKKKALERTVAQEESAIATTEDAIATLAEEIAALEAAIKALDKSVAEATEQRKAENAEFKELMASDGAAKELLGFAKNRLNKFYNPKLYKPPPKVELSAEDRVVENLGGTVTTAAPGGIAGTGIAVLAQVSMHRQLKDAPAPPPETWGAYSKKSGESNGVIAMIDLLVKDLDKEMTEAETEEKDAQADYEKLMADSADKRTTDSKSLTEKKSTKAEMEAELEAHKESKVAATQELMATLKYIQSLHGECDWLLQYFGARKAARADEIDSLGRAKAVLSGADYSFVQTRTRAFLRRAAA